MGEIHEVVKLFVRVVEEVGIPKESGHPLRKNNVYIIIIDLKGCISHSQTQCVHIPSGSRLRL